MTHSRAGSEYGHARPVADEIVADLSENAIMSPMYSLTRKLKTARRIYTEEGLRGAAAVLVQKLP